MNNICTIAVSSSSRPHRLASSQFTQTVINQTTRRLLKIKGFSDTKVEKIKDAAKKLSPITGFMTAAELKIIRQRCFRISTGSKQLDAALNG